MIANVDNDDERSQSSKIGEFIIITVRRTVG